MTEPIQVNQLGQVSSTFLPTKGPATADDQNFAEALAQVQILKFSNHAQKRLQKRDIVLTDDGLNRLAEAVDKVEKRGGRESLVLMDDIAFIVNVKKRLVVTALNAYSRGEGVFTQIDSVVLADFPDPDQEVKLETY